MRKIITTCILLVLTGSVFAAEIPRIDALRSQQTFDDVVIEYDLVGPVGGKAEVLFEVSLDGGQTWAEPKGGVRGDVGADIEVGIDKRIVWDARGDFPGGVETTVDFRVETRAEREQVFALTVEVNPGDAVVRMLNIESPYQPGMTLKPGTYQVEVSKSGYKTYQEWIELSGGDRIVQVQMERAMPEPGSEWQDPNIAMEFVWVPDGCFDMGSKQGDEDERPVHQVCLEGFWMGKYEVTQGEWESVMGSNPSRFPLSDRHPVENISWEDAHAFVVKLNNQGLAKYRLPSEAEWEYACRSAGKTQNYCGGENVDNHGWHYLYSAKKTQPVGQKQPNGLGLYDMSGNVWEWAQDCWNDHYREAPSDGSAWVTGNCERRILRGGSWSNFSNRLRSSYRYGLSPNSRDGNGFRLVLSAPPIE